MISKEKREALVKELKRFSIELEQQKSRAKDLNEDIKAVAKETFGLSTKKILNPTYYGSKEKLIKLLNSN